MRKNIIQEKSFAFSLTIIQLFKRMTEQKEYILSKQLLRSGTSIGANIEEAIAAQSRKDFISKMSIACKEARETCYWLRLIKESKLVILDVNEEIQEAISIINILTKIIMTAQASNS
jgi:four helix bundle protein